MYEYRQRDTNLFEVGYWDEKSRWQPLVSYFDEFKAAKHTDQLNAKTPENKTSNAQSPTTKQLKVSPK